MGVQYEPHQIHPYKPRALLTRLPDIIDIWYHSCMDRLYCDSCLARGNGFNVSSHQVVRFTILTNPTRTPTVGAQYRWTGLYAPPKLMTPAFWGLLQGACLSRYAQEA